jgi:plasmid stabilization system protein ParE
MAEIVWSRAALQDLSRLHRFLQQKDPGAARRAIAAIRLGMAALADHPAIGRPVQAMPVEFREWPIRFGNAGYVAFYRVDAGVVVILAVQHGREEPR